MPIYDAMLSYPVHHVLVRHEQKIEQLTFDDMREMIDEKLVHSHRARALSPDRPVLRGSAQNPDVFFQARETVNQYYQACPGIVEKAMEKFAKLTGRKYNLFDYYGAPDAERVIVIMCSGAETASETAKFLEKQGEKVGVVAVRLYRPFSVDHFVKSLPATVKIVATLGTALRSLAPLANRFTSILSPPSRKAWTGVSPPSRNPLRSLEGAMAYRPRNLPQPRSKACSTRCSRSALRIISPWASPTM